MGLKAYQIDAKNGDDFCCKAIKKEMHNVGIAFKILEVVPMSLVRWTPVTGHIIFRRTPRPFFRPFVILTS